jgi:hypothetical protein
MKKFDIVEKLKLNRINLDKYDENKIRKIFNSHFFWLKFTPFLRVSDYMQIKFECVYPTPF